MREENYFDPTKGIITDPTNPKAVLIELEQLEKQVQICRGRTESLYSRLRSVMASNVQVPEGNTTYQEEPAQVSSQPDRIAVRIKNAKRFIQDSIDLMNEIEARLEL